MPLLQNLISGTKALFNKEQRSRDMDEELRSFQDASADEKIRNGLSPHECPARRPHRDGQHRIRKRKSPLHHMGVHRRRHLARRPLQPSPDGQESRLHHRRHPLTSPRHRRQHRHLPKLRPRRTIMLSHASRWGRPSSSARSATCKTRTSASTAPSSPRQFNAKFAGYKPEQLNGLYDRILTRLDALPGVKSATALRSSCHQAGNWDSPIYIKGYTPAPGEDINTLINRVSADYFKTLDIPVMQGRTIESRDNASSPRIVIVNQTLANHFFPHGDAIGHRFTVARPQVKGEWEIAGIVGNTKYASPRDDARRMIYLPVTQLTGDDSYAYWIQLRTTGDPTQIATAVRAALAEVDPNLPVLEVKTIASR